MTIEELRQGLMKYDKGVLKQGFHQADDHEFCALEFASIMRGHPLSDSPTYLPDLRSLNDAPWSSDRERTEALLPIIAIYWDWLMWPIQRREQVIHRLVLATITGLVATLPGLPENIQERCRSVKSLGEAKMAMEAAAVAVRGVACARAVACAARGVACAEAVEVAACAVACAAVAWGAAEAVEAAQARADAVLRRACRIWIEAAHEVQS